MPGSVTAAFSEPEDFEAAFRAEGCLGLLIIGRGRFRAQLTRIVLHSVRLSAGNEHLSRIAFVAVPAGIVVIAFPIGHGTHPIYAGVKMNADEIMTLSPGEHLHSRTDGACRWGVVWMPVEELIKYGRALTGGPFRVAPAMQRWRPSPAAARRLRSLHAASLRMAAIRPEVLTDAEAARGLEQQLIQAIVECLSGGSAVAEVTTACQREDVLVRFEDLLHTQPARQMRVKEICVALGVTPPQLRRLCTEHLGMSATTYQRLYRISQARRALRCAGGDVLEVAQRCGFPNLRRFTANYRAAFGEPPSATLRRTLALNAP